MEPTTTTTPHRGNRCHCHAPADWMVIAESPEAAPVVRRYFWATCSTHISEAAVCLLTDHPGFKLELRKEGPTS